MSKEKIGVVPFKAAQHWPEPDMSIMHPTRPVAHLAGCPTGFGRKGKATRK